jgi:cbb3-type cytochrome oxidase subunit 1
MDWFVKAFVKSSVTWLALGATLGIAMAIQPTLVAYRTAHLHMMLLGFVAMMIFGVGYHVMPRFAGHPLYSPRAAGIHWWLANSGLVLMVLGFAGRVVGVPAAPFMLGVGGTLAAAGAYTFAWVVWRTLDVRADHRDARELGPALVTAARTGPRSPRSPR